MQRYARLFIAALVLSSAWGCGSGGNGAEPDTSAGGEAASAIDEADVVGGRVARPEAAGAATAEGLGVFQALSSRPIRSVHVVPGTHLAFVEHYDDTSSLLDLESGAIRATRRLAFEGEVEARLVVDETGGFAAIGVMPLPESDGGSGPVYLWDLAADRTRVARRIGAEGYAATDIAISPGGAEIVLFERATGNGIDRGGRVVRVDPFRVTEQTTSVQQRSVLDRVAYSVPRRRAVVVAHRLEGAGEDWTTHIASADGEVMDVAGATGPTVVRPTGGQMLVQTDEAWEARSPSDGRVLATLPIPQSAAVAYSSTGACIVAKVDASKFVFLDPATAHPVAELGAEGVLGMDAIGRCERALTLGHDRSLLLVDLHETDGTPRRFDAASFAWPAEREGTVGLTSTDDGLFAVTWDDVSVVIYDIARGTSSGLSTLGYAPSVWSVAWSARGDALLAQTRESSYVIDGTEAAISDMECGLGYVVATPTNGAFVVEDGREPRCALRSPLAIPEDDRVIRYATSGAAAVVVGHGDIGLVRTGAPRTRIATLGDLRCTRADDCAVKGLFSSDDTTLALMGTGVLVIVDVARGRVVARQPVRPGAHALAFTPGAREILVISDAGFERVPARGRGATFVPLAAPSRVPETTETSAYIAVDGATLRIVSLTGGQPTELSSGEGVWDSVELVSQTDPHLFRVRSASADYLVDTRTAGTRAVRGGELLGAHREGAGIMVATCAENVVTVQRGDEVLGALGDCTGVRQVAISPDGRSVAIVRGAAIELRHADGSGTPVVIGLLETEDAGHVIANGGGRFYAPTPSRGLIRYRAPGDARTAALAEGTSGTGFDARLLDPYFGRAAPTP